MEQGIIEQFVNAIKQEPNDKKTTYSAIVSRIDEEGVIWVYVAGADKDTPTAQTGVEVKKGDNVTVEWRNNKLYIAGNYSNPAAGMVRVVNVEMAAKAANQAAQNAVADAGRAKEAAESAQASATEAKTIAEGIEDIAKDAQESADSARQSADTAFTQLSLVENIVGVLDLIAEHGEYELTQNTEVVPDKWYFNRTGTAPNYVYSVATVATTYSLTTDTEIVEGKTYYTRSGTAPDYVYTPVENPVVEDIGTYYEAFRNPSEQGLYELVGIDTAIQNYVSSHLALVGDTLSLKTDGSPYRLDLTASGIDIVRISDNKPVASYGTETIIGDTANFHVRLGSKEIGFYRGGTRVAYMNGQELYVENSLAFGHFTFIQRDNGHFTLKLIRG